MLINLFIRYHYVHQLVVWKLTCKAFSLQSGKKRKFNTKLSNNFSNNVAKKELKPYLNESLLSRKLSRLERNSYLFIQDPCFADSIALHLCKDWNNGYILESNPGPGVLSKAILSTGLPHLRVFEKNEEFLPQLKALSLNYSNLEIIPEDIMSLPSHEAKITVRESNLFDTFFTDIPKCAWEKEVPCRFFSIISSKKSIKFLRYLLAAIPRKSTIFSFGRCEFFLLLSETEYLYMNAEAKSNFSTYRWNTVLSNLFFEITYLDKYSSEIFYPRPFPVMKKASKEQSFHLVKLTPRSDLFSSVINDNKLVEFYFFVRHHLTKRTGLVIPTIECWIPSCGPRLIKEGMNVFTKFGDLSPKQFILLFNQFSSWPEYEDSSFCVAIQRFRGKHPLLVKEENKQTLPHVDEI